MNTTLNEDGQISIPEQIRHSDRLLPGDSFDLKRLAPGQYIIARNEPAHAPFSVLTAEDGLPLIRGGGETITTELVRQIESQLV